MKTHALSPTTSRSPFAYIVALFFIASLLGCLFPNNPSEPDPLGEDGDSCDVEADPVCNGDGTVTYCQFNGCGFGPCPDGTEVRTVPCPGCEVTPGGGSGVTGYSCDEIPDMSDDMSGDMSEDMSTSSDADMN